MSICGAAWRHLLNVWYQKTKEYLFGKLRILCLLSRAFSQVIYDLRKLSFSLPMLYFVKFSYLLSRNFIFTIIRSYISCLLISRQRYCTMVHGSRWCGWCLWSSAFSKSYCCYGLSFSYRWPRNGCAKWWSHLLSLSNTLPVSFTMPRSWYCWLRCVPLQTHHAKWCIASNLPTSKQNG